MNGACSQPAPGDECAARTGSGLVPGLGAVTEKYEFPVGLGPPACAQSDGKALASSNRFVVAGKGEIHFTLAEGACMAQQGIYNETQAYSITGGTGIYAGASGSGTVERNLGEEGYTGRNGTRDVDGDPQRAGARVRHDPTEIHRCDEQDGASREGRQDAPRALHRHRTRRQGRGGPGC